MAHFHTLTIADVKRETADTVSIAFDIPENLKSDFKYIQGQYLTFKAQINGEEVRRSYSLCSSPSTDNELRVAIKKVPNGLFSTYANESLKTGDTLETMPPMGNFYTELKEGQSKRYVAFAAGSGITPVLSILKTSLTTETNSRFTLFYGNRNSDSIIFKNELSALAEKYADRLNVHHILSREEQSNSLLNGRIDAEKCKGLCESYKNVQSADEFFLCGPAEMIDNVTNTLSGLGVDKKHIHFELFNTPVMAENQPKRAASKSSNGLSTVTVIMDGDETTFELSSNGDSVLDAALDAGVDVPFACKGAVCCTCKAKVKEGDVEMDMNYALEDEEVEEGFILTCQSHPKSATVIVDYDEGI